MADVLRRVSLKYGVDLEIVRGDITLEATDAIVNAANELLQHGGGVAHAIVRRGGQGIQSECNGLGPVPTGSAVLTGAGMLACRYVIHAVGPVWNGGARKEEILLASAVESALRMADDLGLSSVAFPAISSGIFGFPKKLAAEVIIQTIRTFIIRNTTSLQLVRCTIIDEETTAIFCDVLDVMNI